MGGGGVSLISESAVANTLAFRKVVPHYFIAFHDTRSEPSGIFYYPIPAGELKKKAQTA